MKKASFLSAILVVTSFGVISAQDEADIRFVHQNGFGVRAYSMANNYVALSNDLSGLYWNPAAMSFSPVREFQIGLDGHRLNAESSFFGNEEIEKLHRFKLTSAGLMFAVPASQGGLSFALAYSNPVIFDDVSAFSGNYSESGDRVYSENLLKISGGLRYFTGGFGIQVMPSLAAGMAVSLVTGKENYKNLFSKDVIGREDSWGTGEVNSVARYIGYDLRGGLMYQTGMFGAGLRISIPNILIATDKGTDSYTDTTLNFKTKTKMTSSYSGAAGASLILPFLTLSTECRVTLPFDFVFPSENIPSNSQAGYFKVGGGAGVEIPVVVLPIIFRVGYSIDELDLHTYAFQYLMEDGEEWSEIDWSDGGIKVNRNKQQITAGLGFSGSSVSFDLSYGYSTWGIVTRNILKQDYDNHRLMASLAIRY